MPRDPGQYDRFSYATLHVAEAHALAKDVAEKGEVAATDFVVLRRALLKALHWIPEEHI